MYHVLTPLIFKALLLFSRNVVQRPGTFIMASFDEIKALFNQKFDSLHEKLSEQAKEQNDLLRFTKAISNDITDAQSGIEQLRASLETLSLASTATSQAFDKLIERIVALEESN